MPHSKQRSKTKLKNKVFSDNFDGMLILKTDNFNSILILKTDNIDSIL